MEILREEIKKNEIASIAWFKKYYKYIAGNKFCEDYHMVMECFSVEIWERIPVYPKENKRKKGGKYMYKLSPGKMNKNLIKLYFLEMPLDYVILEIVDKKQQSIFNFETGNMALKFSPDQIQEDYYITIRISS